MDRCSIRRTVVPFLAALAACRPAPHATRQQQRVPVARIVDSTAKRTADSIPRATATAAVNDTTVQGEPVPSYVVATCDSASGIMHEVLGRDAHREDGAYHDSFVGQQVRIGCRLRFDGSFEGPQRIEDPVGSLQKGFERHGWRFDLRYSADGPDGSTIGMRSRDKGCLVSGRWDGGDDSEPDSARTKPDPSFQVIVECARDVTRNANRDVPDSIWSIASQAGLDSIYAFSFRFHSPPYEVGDFDGDGVVDAAVLIEHRASGKAGLAIVRRGVREVAILGAGTDASGPDDLNWVDAIEVFPRGTTWHLTIGDRPFLPLISDALWVAHGDSVSAFYVWTGKSFVFEPHGIKRPR
ncbi:MAG: hypothetical protein M3Z10_07870 [Gemmatimonadota bacterium]|nr:hypothetical protein [Gemmatimonadota bacterium]